MSTPDTEELDQRDMARLAAGHDAALDSLMERHAGALFGFLCRFIGDQDAANDLAQETFVRVYQNRARFKPGLRFSTWLFTIAGNLARNHLRTRSRRPEVSLDSGDTEEGPTLAQTLPDSGGTPADHALVVERQTVVRQAVGELSEELREAIVLCELEDRTLTEAAGILTTTVKVVESRLYRARQLLRHRLSRWLAT